MIYIRAFGRTVWSFVGVAVLLAFGFIVVHLLDAYIGGDNFWLTMFGLCATYVFYCDLKDIRRERRIKELEAELAELEAMVDSGWWN